MIFKHFFLKGSLLGIISGVLIGLFLKAAEAVTGKKVYTLLLNVDFIPYLGKVIWPEYAEFLFHLIIAVMLGITFYFLADKWELKSSSRFYLAVGLTFPAMLLYFPLALLAIKEVPSATDWTAFFYWAAAHMLFAVSMHWLFLPVKKWRIE